MPSAAGIFVHPCALCESEQIGPGTQIWAFAHVMKGAVVGGNCNIGDHTFIETGARIGDRVTIKNQVMVWDGIDIEDDVFIGPGVSFTNDACPRSPRMRLPAVAARYRSKAGWLLRTRVENGASIGARCVILAGATIGAYAMVAAGAVVTREVRANALVAGMPAKGVGWVCRCGTRLLPVGAAAWRCSQCGELYEIKARGCTSLAKSC